MSARVATALLSLALVGIGISAVVRAALAGGSLGILLGSILLLAGGSRLYLALRGGWR